MSGPQPVIQENRDGSICVAYKPTEKGVHEVGVTFNEKQVEGTPFRCHVDQVGKGFITAYGPGLIQGSTGNVANFNVVGGNVTDLDINIKGPTRTDVTKKEKVDNHLHVEWLPPLAGEYMVGITNKGKHIHGSPFSVKVSGGVGEGRKRSQLALTATSEIPLGGKDVDMTNLVGTITTPSGNQEDGIFKRLSDGKLGLSSFAPKQKGKYSVDVKQDGVKFPGSPFSVQVGDSQVANASGVMVNGAGMKNPQANEFNDVSVDVSKAGYGPLSLTIEGGHRSDIQAKEEDKGKYTVSFKPHEPGIYIMNVRFADEAVTGSPFLLSVGGMPSGRVRETVSKIIDPAAGSPKGVKCEFQLKIPDTDPLEMEAYLTNPAGDTEPCEIMDKPDNMYDIHFTPVYEGMHTVSLKYKGLHIAGSPFQYTVGKAPAFGSHKVDIGGQGLSKAEVDAKNEFNVYTREAGGGELTIAIEGPSKALIDIHDSGKGFTVVSYKVSKEGEYGIHVKYNGDHVHDSPTNVVVTPASSDAKKVTVHGLRDRGSEVSGVGGQGLKIGKPTTFTVNLNGAQGTLKAHVDTPAGTEEEVYMQDMDTELYALRFMPKENGVYYVHIKLNEAHIPGSPYAMMIGDFKHDPELVMASGDGLEKAKTGRAAKFTVNTTKAGAGVMNVTLDGPSRVAISCHDVDEGYEITYTPKAPGDYLCSIKFGNIHIAGSPYKVNVTGPGKGSTITEKSVMVIETVEKKPGAPKRKRFLGDATKVIAKGTGLQKSFINRNSTFNLDVNKAGNAVLSLGMISPKGNPVDELTCKKQRNQYVVTYKTSERGEHTLSIKWGADEIPGSPFCIKVT